MKEHPSTPAFLVVFRQASKLCERASQREEMGTASSTRCAPTPLQLLRYYT